MSLKTINASLANTAYVKKVCEHLKKHFDVSLPDVMRGEAVAIAKTCANWAPILQTAKIFPKAVRKALRGNDFSLGTGARGGKAGYLWFRDFQTGKFHLVDTDSSFDNVKMKTGHHLPLALWNTVSASFNDYLKDVDMWTNDIAQKQGLTAGSWYSVALATGFSASQIDAMPPKLRGKERRARAPLVGAQCGFGSVRLEGSVNIKLIATNVSRLASKTDRGKLARAVRSRGTAFKKSLEKGVFNAAATTVKQYRYVSLISK